MALFPLISGKTYNLMVNKAFHFTFAKLLIAKWQLEKRLVKAF